MGLSKFKWMVIKEDSSVTIIEAETAEEVVEEVGEEQPKAIIRGELVW